MPVAPSAFRRSQQGVVRCPASATTRRRSTFNINGNGNTQTATGIDGQREWARGHWTALGPYHQSVYVNFLMDLFRLNQNIRPD